MENVFIAEKPSRQK